MRIELISESKGRIRMPDDVISQWLSKVHGVDEAFAQAIWEMYFEKLLKLARVRLGSIPRREQDEEDVALSAIDSFLRGAEGGRYPQLADQDDLWRLLVTITVRKAIAQKRRFFAKRRGGGRVRGESLFWEAESPEGPGGIEEVLGDSPSEELAEQVLDTCGDLVARLRDPQLRTIALYKMESYTNEEIALLIGCSTRTVHRRLEQIRREWTRLSEAETSERE